MAYDEFSGLDQLVTTGALSLGSPSATRAAKPLPQGSPQSALTLKRHDILASSSPVVRQAVTANNAARLATKPLPASMTNAAAMQAVAQNVIQRSTATASPTGISHVSRQPTKGQAPMSQDSAATSEQQLNFVSKAITTLSSASAVAKPQNSFRPTRLVVPSSIGPFFVLNNIRIGTDSQFVNTIEAPALVYAENAVGTAFVLGVANPGIDITLDVTNTDTATHDFRASMFGQVWK